MWVSVIFIQRPSIRSKEERDKLLRGTGIPEAVDTDLSNIHQEYAEIAMPFMMRHPDLWNPSTHTLELYKQLVAFVMAYRFAHTVCFFIMTDSQFHFFSPLYFLFTL